MKKSMIALTGIMLMLILTAGAFAETKLEITGQVRVRGEGSRIEFDSTFSHMQTFTDMRTRVNVSATVDDNAIAFVQFQDSRRLGGGSQSGGLTDSKNVDLHQAYLKYTLWQGPNWKIGGKAGRFEFNWGNQRLLGSVGWNNVGRAWEGAMVWYKHEDWKLYAAMLKAMELNSTSYNRDFDVYALGATFNQYNLSLLALYELNSDTTDLGPDIKSLKRTTLMAFYERTVDQFDMEFNFAYQTGNMPGPSPAIPNTSEYDISAMMFSGEVGYNLEGDRNGRVAVGLDYASGDDNSTDFDWKEFNNLYWTGHKFNGFMDYFTSGGPNGLMDLMLRGRIDITSGWTLMGDLHLFSSAEEYSFTDDRGTSPVLIETKDVGTEIDITIKTTRIKGLTAMWGLSYFAPKDNFAFYMSDDYSNAAFDKQAGLWLYEQIIVNF